jgi:hypothetical protein
MLTPGIIVTIGYALVLAALMTWFVRRHAKARSAYRRRAAIIAKMREEVDKDGPIIGWMVRDDPAPVKPGRRVRDLH